MHSQNTNSRAKVRTKVSKLEILGQMRKQVLGGVKEFGRGYVSEQLVSTFNTSGYRFAKKKLNATLDMFELKNKFETLGHVTGMLQDYVTMGAAFSLSRWGSFDNAPEVAQILIGIAGAKVATNVLSFAGSKIYDLYKSSKKSLEERRGLGSDRLKNEYSWAKVD